MVLIYNCKLPPFVRSLYVGGEWIVVFSRRAIPIAIALGDSLLPFSVFKGVSKKALFTVSLRTLLNNSISVLFRISIYSRIKLVEGIVEQVGRRRAYRVGYSRSVIDNRGRY